MGLILAVLWVGYPKKTDHITYGVTWSAPYAEGLGISSREGLNAVLDDLGIRYFRIPVYWSLVERQPGVYDWNELNQQLDAIEARQGKVILAVGQKVPRWPECWMPDWVKTMSSEEREQAVQVFLEATLRTTAHRPSVQAYQVENEPLFPFGDCPNISFTQVKREMTFVRLLDRALGFTHDIYTTDSGEFAPWLGFSRLIDGLGVSVYRSTRDVYFGVRKYHFIPPWYYTHKAWLIRLWEPNVYISEFQMEPWVNGAMKETPLEQQFESFDLRQLTDNGWTAEHAGFKNIYLWGAEWWYWMKTQKGHPEFWEAVRTILLFDRGITKE